MHSSRRLFLKTSIRAVEAKPIADLVPALTMLHHAGDENSSIPRHPMGVISEPDSIGLLGSGENGIS